jgi:hypothetical protein
MSSLLQKLAVSVATVLLLASCGDSGDSGDSPAGESGSGSDPSSSAPSEGSGDGGADSPEGSDGSDGDGSDGEGTVAREAFCDRIDPTQVADLLGIDEAQVIADYAPGDEIPTGTDAAPIVSPSWTCTVGTTDGGSVGATWNVGDTDATPKDVVAALQRQSLALGKDSCSDAEDDVLGPDTRAIDCGGTVGGTSFTLAARSAVVDGTQLDCSIASTRGDDLEVLVAAIPEICGLFVDVVVQ